jgi:hypothetical protein
MALQRGSREVPSAALWHVCIYQKIMIDKIRFATTLGFHAIDFAHFAWLISPASQPRCMRGPNGAVSWALEMLRVAASTARDRGHAAYVAGASTFGCRIRVRAAAYLL